MSISHIGQVFIPLEVFKLADEIKHQNYKVNTPRKFQKHAGVEKGREIVERVAELAGISPDKVDYVYFSMASGAKEHVDELDPEVFTNNTFVVPIILPLGENTITCDGKTLPLLTGVVYKLDHSKPHSAYVSDHEHGAVVLMMSELK